MWNAYKDTDAFCITTNSYIRNDGRLVMGRGIARAARDSIEGIDKTLGEKIRGSCGHLGVYGTMPADPEESRIVAFQVKKHFKDKASVDLIEKSTSDLSRIAKKHPNQRFDLNFPGIGNGGLDVEDVKHLVTNLPQNVRVWRFSSER